MHTTQIQAPFRTFSRDAISNADLRILCNEAESAGDAEMASLCEAALEGDPEAAEKCIDAIEDAWHRAQD
jgi:ferritin-like metal-binding protein YciE